MGRSWCTRFFGQSPSTKLFWSCISFEDSTVQILQIMCTYSLCLELESCSNYHSFYCGQDWMINDHPALCWNIRPVIEWHTLEISLSLCNRIAATKRKLVTVVSDEVLEKMAIHEYWKDFDFNQCFSKGEFGFTTYIRSRCVDLIQRGTFPLVQNQGSGGVL